MVVFQSTLPARGATYRVADERYSEEISIHAPRTGSDCAGRNGRTEQQDFNPRSPHGERPGPHSTNKNAISFQSTLPARGATVVVKVPICRAAISIHAPRTGSDGTRRSSCGSRSNFNPRSPHGERRACKAQLSATCQFQSTLPARGATRNAGLYYRGCNISIHAPRTGSDAMALCCFLRHNEFQSTLPARGATSCRLRISDGWRISIHAPRTGSDRR